MLIPLSSEEVGSVLLGLVLVLLLTTVLWQATPLTIYTSVCIGELVNIWLYMHLDGYKRWVLACLAMYSIVLNLMVWVDAYANLLHVNYYTLNTFLLESTLVVLTFSSLGLSRFIKTKAP